MESSKSQRVLDFFPSLRPSCLSVILVFVCGVLWLKNEATNDRLITLEKQMNVFTDEFYILPLDTARNHIPPTDEAKSLRMIPEPLEKSVKRSRRHAIDNTTRTVTLEDLSREIAFQLGKFIPSAYCRSKGRVCPAGPPGRPGPRGGKGPRGRRGLKGTRGKKGLEGGMGPPGKSGKSGMVGPTGPRGEKGNNGTTGSRGVLGARGDRGMIGTAGTRGEKGDNGEPGPKGVQGGIGQPGMIGPTGPRGENGVKGETGSRGTIGFPGARGDHGMIGIPGTRGEKGDKGEPGPKGVQGPPGEHSLPDVTLTPAEVIIDEGQNTTFECFITGNPSPIVYWKYEGVRLSSGLKYSIYQGVMVISQVNFSDTGQYSCVATSVLGSDEAFGNLTVRAAPIFTKRPPTLTMPIESTDFSETCQAEGFPAPVSNWTRLLQPFPLARTEVSGENLTITNLTTTDSGLYECVVANNMGIKKVRMNLVVQKGVDCSCWRTQEKSPSLRYDRYSYRWKNSPIYAIGFQVSDNMILRGYRLWNNNRLFPKNNFTIELHQENSSIAAKSSTYDSSLSRENTFEVYFPRAIYLQAGVNYTAVVRVSGTMRYTAQNVGINNNVCSGVNVVFMKSGLGISGSYPYVRQISALIFLSLKC